MIDETFKGKLKPCPFCGGKARIRGNASKGHIYVECQECEARGSWHMLQGEAIKAWNGRAENV